MLSHRFCFLSSQCQSTSKEKDSYQELCLLAFLCLFCIGQKQLQHGRARRLWTNCDLQETWWKNLDCIFSRVEPICQLHAMTIFCIFWVAFPLQATCIFTSNTKSRPSGQVSVQLMVRLDLLCRHPVGRKLVARPWISDICGKLVNLERAIPWQCH